MAARDAELEAVESALTSLAFADSEKALEKVVARLLPGLLAALATKSAAARAKCIETLQHINVRLRAAPAVSMPFDAVVAVAVAPTAALMTRNVAIQGGYVSRCFDRHPAPGDAFVPLVNAGSSVTGEQNREALLALALKALEARVRATPSRTNLDAAFKELLDNVPAEALEVFLRYGQRAMRSKTKAVASHAELLALVRLCVEYAGLQAPERAVRIFPTLLVAAGDTSRDAVCSAGEDGLKRIDTCDVLLAHDPSLVHSLFEIFLDASAEIPLRSTVLSKGLLRATLSASCFPEVTQVVEQSVYKPGVPDRLRSLGMQYVSFVVANASADTLREHGLDLLRGMLKVIQDDTDGSPSFSPVVRGFAYTALAEILVQVPTLLDQHAQFTPELFFSAAQSPKEPAQVRAAASHALSTLAPVFSLESNDSRLTVILRPSLLKTLRRTIENSDDLASSARAAAVLWANVCFAFSDADARLLNVIAAGDSRPDVREAALAGLSPKRYRSMSLRTDHKNELKHAPADVNEAHSSDQADSSSSKRLKTSTSPKDIPTDSMDVDTVNDGCGSGTEVLFPDFSEIVELVAACAEEGSGLRVQSRAAFLRFALLTLRRAAQKSVGTEFDRPDAWRGARAAEVKHYIQQEGNEMAKTALRVLREFADQCILDDGIPSGVKVERAALCVILFAAEIDQAEVASVYVKHVNALVLLCVRKCAAGGGAIVDGVAMLTGIASTAMSEAELEQLLRKLADSLAPESTGRPSGRHGEDEREAACLCVGQIISAFLEKQPAAPRWPDNAAVPVAVGAVARRFQGAVESSVRVRVAACAALAAIGVKRELPLPLRNEGAPSESPLPVRGVVVAGLAGILQSDKSDAKLVEASSNALGKICVGEPRSSFSKLAVDAILAVGRTRKEDEVRFTAGESLVRAAVGFDAPPPVSLRKEEDATEDEELAHLLYSGSTDVSFATVIHDKVDGNLDAENSSLLRNTLKSVTELCYNPRPHSRAGACVFLVTFLRLIGSPHASSEKVQYAFATDGDVARFHDAQQVISEMLPDCQKAFTTLLADRSEFAQQLASRGVTLIYDMSSAKEQKELVSTLVRSLTSGKRKAATTVAGDEGGLLDINGLPVAPSEAGVGSNAEGSAGSGGAATYKELCSLASDMGQPELVYKFLDLAGHTALWNNRRGAALAGSALLGTDLAAEQLKPHIKTLLPRLYVYCYDPAEGVRSSMSAVLRSVATAGGFGTVSEAITEHFDGVAEHCLSSMTSRQWRVREAGAGAFRDLLPSRHWKEVEHHLEKFWYVGLRAMDDIKESVRNAADRAGRALSTLSIRLCDPNMSGAATASAAVAIVVPAILPAFTHGVKEVRMLATTTLSKVIRTGGETLRPSIPDIVTSLLESATELEPQAFNYLTNRIVDADQRDEIETMRADAAAMSSSPVVDSLERLSVLVDESIAGEIVIRLARLSRTGVGVPTRAATARFFSSLLMTRAVVMEPYATKMMNAAMNAAQMELNASARRAWSNAVGLAARLAPTESVAKMASSIADLSGAESAQDRALASFLALGMWRNSPETARKHSSDILPVAYMGRYEGDENAKNASANWKEVWGEGAPSSDAGLRMYSAEITKICAKRLTESSQYKVKRSAAAALGAMAGAVTSSSASEVGNTSLATAAAALIGALPGHIWEGKDAALTAIGTIASAASKSGEGSVERTTAVWSRVGGANAVVTAMIRECRRGKREYRLSAMSALRHVLLGCHDDGSDYVEMIVESLAQEWDEKPDAVAADVARTVWETGSDANAVDARNKARKAERSAAIAAIGCLEAAYPGERQTLAAPVMMARLTTVLSVLISLVSWDREVRTAAFERLSAIIPRAIDEWACPNSDGSDNQLQRIAKAGLVGVADARYSSVRNMAFKMLLAVTQRASSTELISSLCETEREVLKSALERDAASDSIDAAALSTTLAGSWV